ncbi:hypothetical protein TNCT_53851 [Trichonephila clavata]|uniref:Uncharacterized protein n=2 Tax=Trichonephila clavata TaxID=2740835 RepID=A0A8X6HYM4_TRICU|nr:hypothetical protein TNCT_53851 [Trichonephila clavata]
MAFLRAGVKRKLSQERATAESASPPEKIPTPLVESASPPVEQPADKIPTPPAKSVSPPAKSVSPPAKSVSPPVEQPADKIPTPPAKSTSPPAKCVSPPAKRLVEPERPVTPLERVDPSVLMTGAHVEVTSRLPTPPLMTRCNKSTQAYSSHLELGKRLLEQPPFLPNKKLAIQPKTPTQPIHTIVLFVPEHHPLLKSGMCRFILQPHPVKNVNK